MAAKITHGKKGKRTRLPKASIVCATLNNSAQLRDVVKAMLKLDYPSFEVIVVNDGSSDNTKEMLAENFGKNPLVKVISLQRSGVCKARNAGIRAAGGEIVVNMDHDCIPEKDWLKEMVKPFANPKVGVVSGYNYYGGTSTAFRKELLEKVGGYDEDYFYYREDTDLSFKIMDLGFEFVLTEKARFLHDHPTVKVSGFWKTLNYALQRMKYHQNDVLLLKKHPTKKCREFLNVVLGFVVNPLSDFKAATGTWWKNPRINLSSPRGVIFLENKSALHTLAILAAGIAYAFAIKGFRLYGSIRFGKLLV